MASITLRRETTTREETRQSYSMRIETINAVDMPEELFVFQRGVAPARSGVETEPTDQFISIADPLDLQEYPPNSPDLLNEIPFFRTKTLVLSFRSPVEMDETWGFINEEVQGLVDALNTPFEYPETEDFVYS